ncbi:MAG: hypothetical protein J5738_03480 [Lachnospiraceae bacterium]|nr:hypothetical protein [Lachnospiraceae bacterium]
MKDENVISKFQIRDWRVAGFDCTNTVLSIPREIDHHWKINAHIDSVEPDGELLRAILQIEFHFWAEIEGRKIQMNGVAAALCEMDKSLVQDAETVFQNLLSHTAIINCLANLRVFLFQTAMLLQMGTKPVILPFINLNNFKFDEDYEFTV